MHNYKFFYNLLRNSRIFESYLILFDLIKILKNNVIIYRPSCLDAHSMEPDNSAVSGIKPTFVAQVMGNVIIGGIRRAYQQVLILAHEDGNYKIKSESYRYIE